MIFAPDRPKARFPPSCSRCQCVLNTVVTRPAPGSSRRRLCTASVNSAAPLSTSTWPALAVRTRTLPPAPVSITKPSRTGTTAGLSWEKAERTRGGRVRPRTPPNAPFTMALRFMAESPECLAHVPAKWTPVRRQEHAPIKETRACFASAGTKHALDIGDLAGAVPEALHLQTRLVQQREVQIGNRRAFGQLDLPSPLERAGAAADQDVRQRIIAVQVAVGHVGAVEQHGVIQQRAFAVGGGGELRHELREPLHVIALDLDQLFKPIGIIGMM